MRALGKLQNNRRSIFNFEIARQVWKKWLISTFLSLMRFMSRLKVYDDVFFDLNISRWYWSVSIGTDDVLYCYDEISFDISNDFSFKKIMSFCFESWLRNLHLSISQYFYRPQKIAVLSKRIINNGISKFLEFSLPYHLVQLESLSTLQSFGGRKRARRSQYSPTCSFNFINSSLYEGPTKIQIKGVYTESLDDHDPIE